VSELAIQSEGTVNRDAQTELVTHQTPSHRWYSWWQTRRLRGKYSSAREDQKERRPRWWADVQILRILWGCVS